MRYWMIAVAIFVAFLVVASLVLDEGEVIHLSTLDGEGREHESDIWIVEIDDVLFVRANGPDARWLQRLRANPQVTVERDGELSSYEAVALAKPEVKTRVDQAMAEKYGLPNGLWVWLTRGSETIPIRLDRAQRSEGSP